MVDRPLGVEGQCVCHRGSEVIRIGVAFLCVPPIKGIALPGGIGRLIGFLSVKDILHRHVVAALGIKGHGKCAAVDGAIICHRAAECAAADGSAGLVLHRAVEYAVLDGTALILHRAAECAAADGAPIIHGACFGKCAIGDFAFSCIFHRAAECAVLDVTFIVHFAVECTAADGAALIPHPIVKCAADDSAIPLRHLAVKSAAADSAVVKIHCVRCRTPFTAGDFHITIDS